MAVGDPVKINSNTVTIDSVRMVLTEDSVPTAIPLSFVSLTYDAGDTDQNEPILNFNIQGTRPVFTPLSSRLAILSNGGVNAVKDENGTALAADTEIWYIIPNVPAPTVNSLVTAEYISGLGASGQTVVGPNYLASQTGPIRIKFKSEEIA